MCLAHPAVEEVRAITRRPLTLTHAKLTVVIHNNYQDYASVAAAMRGVDACLYCLGISVSQVSGEPEYRKITRDFAVAAAGTLVAQSPLATFHFLSGRGASVDSRFMRARVKGETERELMDLVEAVCWRPAGIDGMPSASEPLKYRLLRPLLRVFRPIPRSVCDGRRHRTRDAAGHDREDAPPDHFERRDSRYRRPRCQTSGVRVTRLL